MKVNRKPGPGQERLNNLLKALNDKKAQVGWFESAKYPNGMPVAYVATIQEYGYAAGGIPPRPFIRTTITDKRNEWRAILQNRSKLLAGGTMTLQDVMETIGIKASGDIKYTISTIQDPPLKEETVKSRARKLSSHEVTSSLRKPLIETALMFNTCTYLVTNA